MNASLAKHCPGLFCGRTYLAEEDAWSECGACPKGYRVSGGGRGGACLMCLDHPSSYDWLYLAFMAVIALILHWFFVDRVERSPT